MKKTKRIIRLIIIIASWLVVWGIISLIINKDIIFPSPFDVIGRLSHLIITLPFWQAVFFSLIRIITGYLIALIFGAGFGTLTAFSKIADAFFSPVAKVIRATPVASFILLLFVFAAKNNIPAITAFLMVTPIVWANVHEGILSADKKLLEMAKVFHLSKPKVFKNIYLPSLMPYFITSAKLGIGFAWKAGIAAEVLINPAFGIGRALYESKIYLETTDLFAWTIAVIILSFILEKLLVKLINAIYATAKKKYNSK